LAPLVLVLNEMVLVILLELVAVSSGTSSMTANAEYEYEKQGEIANGTLKRLERRNFKRVERNSASRTAMEMNMLPFALLPLPHACLFHGDGDRFAIG
jgi:hypothetical protein